MLPFAVMCRRNPTWGWLCQRLPVLSRPSLLWRLLLEGPTPSLHTPINEKLVTSPQAIGHLSAFPSLCLPLPFTLHKARSAFWLLRTKDKVPSCLQACAWTIFSARHLLPIITQLSPPCSSSFNLGLPKTSIKTFRDPYSPTAPNLNQVLPSLRALFLLTCIKSVIICLYVDSIKIWRPPQTSGCRESRHDTCSAPKSIPKLTYRKCTNSKHSIGIKGVSI